MAKNSPVDLGELVEDVVEGITLGDSTNREDRLEVSSHRIARSPNNEHDKTERGRRVQRVTSQPCVLVDIDPFTDFIFETDVGAWKRIVMNIFGNALKYTEQGRVDVRLYLTEAPVTSHELTGPKTTSHVCFEVIDTGCGMQQDYLRNGLFVPYSQENNLSTGTGLGMSIVLRLVNELGGTIDVESAPSAGTKVKIDVPIGNDLQPVVQILPVEGRTRKLIRSMGDRVKGSVLHVPTEPTPKPSCFPSDSLTLNQTSSVQVLFAKIAEHCLGMELDQQPRTRHPEMRSPQRSFTLLRSNTRSDPAVSDWVVRVPSTMSSESLHDKPGHSHEQHDDIQLRQPFGRRALATALAQAIALPSQPEQAAISSSFRAANGVGDAGVDLCERNITSSTPDTAPRTTTTAITTVQRPPTGLVQSDSTILDRPLNLLLVDDNLVNLRILSRYIEQFGHAYTQATNGQEAVDAFKEASLAFDVVFMDISMPVMDGYQAAREIRNHESEVGGRVQIIALTALGSEDARNKALTSGIDLFIRKPAKMAEIQALLASVRR